MKQVSLIALTALLVAACGAERSEDIESVRVSELPHPEQPTNNGFADPGKGIAIVSGSEAASIDISLPANIETLDSKLAAEIRRRADSGKDGFLDAAQNDRMDAENGGFPFRPHSLTVSWEHVGPQDGPLRSFLGSYAAYTGGAHPNYRFDVLNWDVEASEEIGFSDLFEDTDDARGVLRDALEARLVEAKRERLNDFDISDEKMIETWLRPAFEDNSSVFENFTIARAEASEVPGGLIYHFEPYVMGSYAEGPYEIAVPAAVFEAELAPRYREVFDTQATAVANPPAP
ncbi:DUF3298 and DUF4163 domain-containing protein [Henriciella marina]|uniref:DUF3298 and DUF4163 domain-containing protein n=1 Tax=Henriciella marina TaxID=453851 RepID=UPI000369BF97|nr:DUF3298 and DUF4163 domain-containing protein [Henriciella marina]